MGVIATQTHLMAMVLCYISLFNTHQRIVVIESEGILINPFNKLIKTLNRDQLAL